MSILIVDDSPTARTALASILQTIGYTDVEAAESAAQALAILQAEQHPPADIDLVLMDLLMPEMDGIAAIRAIKSNQRLRDIPIIVVSASDEEERVEEAFEAGAIDFINKPVRRLELRARLRSALKLKQEQDYRKAHQIQLEHTIEDLQAAMARVKVLSGLLPICTKCKKVRDDGGYWTQVETYVQQHSDAEFTHGLCPDCIRELYPKLADEILSDESPAVTTSGVTSLGVVDWHYFSTVLETNWLRAAQESLPVSVVLVDVAPVSSDAQNTIGPAAFLRAAAVIQKALPQDGHLLAHCGERRFAVLLPQVDHEGTQSAADAIRRALLAAFPAPAKEARIRVGAATVIPERAADPLDLMEAANQALNSGSAD